MGRSVLLEVVAAALWHGHLRMSLLRGRHGVCVWAGVQGPPQRQCCVRGSGLPGSGQLFGSQQGSFLYLIRVNPMSHSFQIERTSPFCARKCLCVGGGACVTPDLFFSWGLLPKPRFMSAIPSSSPAPSPGHGPYSDILAAQWSHSTMSFISCQRFKRLPQGNGWAVGGVYSREEELASSQHSSVGNSPLWNIPSGSEQWLSLPELK